MWYVTVRTVRSSRSVYDGVPLMFGPARVLSGARYIIGHVESLNTRMCSAHTPERIELSPIRNGTDEFVSHFGERYRVAWLG
jgi:hypothetical protein